MSAISSSHNLFWGGLRLPEGVKPVRRFRLKDHYWFKTAKWLAYKKHFGSAGWATRYAFDTKVRALGPDSVAIDCGANLGEFTQLLASTGATVHAFEPDPYTFSRLESHTRGMANVTCHHAAVGASEEPIRLYRSEKFEQNPDAASISASIFSEKSNVDANNFVECRQVDLAAFLQTLPGRVDLLKVDIEGAEVDLLEHLLSDGSLARCDAVFVETHEDRIPALAERTEKLRRLAQTEKYLGRLFMDWH